MNRIDEDNLVVVYLTITLMGQAYIQQTCCLKEQYVTCVDAKQ